MNKSEWTKFLFLGSFRNLWRSPRRTMISLFAIAAAASSLIVFQSFVEGVRDTFRENVITSQYGHYQIYPKIVREDPGLDPYEHVIKDEKDFKEKISREVAPLAFMSRQERFFGLISNGDQSTGGVGIGIEADEEKKFLTLNQVHAGKHLADSGKESIFIGYDFADKLKVKVGDYVTVVVNTSSGSINALDLEVVGTFKSGVSEMDSGMYMVHYETAKQLLEVEGAQRILIGFEDSDETQHQAKLNAFMEKNYPHLEAVHWQELASYFENTMGWLDSIFTVFRIIIILIATLSIVNVFTITLMERIGEFGTMRAIGTKRSEIISMILVEGLMQAVFGTAMGVLMGVGIIQILLAGGISMPPPMLMTTPFQVTFAIPWIGVAITSGLCILIAGGSGVWPAIKMSKINIVQALGRNV